MRHTIALAAALCGCGQMYKSHDGQQTQPPAPPQQPAADPGMSAPGAPGGGDNWGAQPAQPAQPAMPAQPAQPAAPPVAAAAGSDAQRLVNAHNKARAQHCAQPLSWSPKLAAVAQDWANKLRDQGCKFGHSGGQYGENLAAGTTGAMDPEAVVAMWYDEIKGYSYQQPGFSMQTGHFTQVVWRSTTQVGCGMAQCNGNDIWVCEYDPPGNWEGQYREQVLPVGCK
jgi:uncharacterized protein YkwD